MSLQVITNSYCVQSSPGALQTVEMCQLQILKDNSLTLAEVDVAFSVFNDVICEVNLSHRAELDTYHLRPGYDLQRNIILYYVP